MDGVGITGMISGPITDSLRGRLVAKKYEDDGYVENKASGGKDGPQQDNLSLRAVLDWDATEDLNFLFKAEHNENDVIGRQQVLSKANPGAIALYQAFGDPTAPTSMRCSVLPSPACSTIPNLTCTSSPSSGGWASTPCAPSPPTRSTSSPTNWIPITVP